MANFQYLAPSGDIAEAVQFKAEDQDLTQAWPRWFIDLLIDQKIERFMPEKKWYLNRKVIINNNDWVVALSNMEIVTFSNEEFVESFRPVVK